MALDQHEVELPDEHTRGARRPPEREGVRADRGDPVRPHGPRGRRVVRGREHRHPDPDAVGAGDRQVRARRPLVHAPEVRRSPLRTLLRDGPRRCVGAVPGRVDLVPGRSADGPASVPRAPGRARDARRAGRRLPARRAASRAERRASALQRRTAIPLPRWRGRAAPGSDVADPRSRRELPLQHAHGAAHAVHVRRGTTAAHGNPGVDVARAAPAGGRTSRLGAAHPTARGPDRRQRRAVLHPLARRRVRCRSGPSSRTSRCTRCCWAPR